MTPKKTVAEVETHAFEQGMPSGRYRGGVELFLCGVCSTVNDSARHPKDGAEPTQPKYPPTPDGDRSAAILGEHETESELGDEWPRGGR